MELIPVTIKIPYDRQEYSKEAEAPIQWCQLEEQQGWAFQGYGFTKGRTIVATPTARQKDKAPGMFFCLTDYVTGHALGNDYSICPATGPMPEDIDTLHRRCAKKFNKEAKEEGLTKAGFWKKILEGRPELNTEAVQFSQA